jgi:hypothetical protein
MDDKANEIIESFEKTTGKIPKRQRTPGKPGEVLSKNEGKILKHGESILGKIMFYVTKLSPECSYACGQLARHMHNPGSEHWSAMERMVGYLKSKKEHVLVLRRPINLIIASFGDASYADCKDTRRSSTGDIHTIGGCLVSWRAQKTRFVCLSSTEAEYVALTEVCKEQRFLAMLMREVFEVNLPCIIHEDNEATTYLAKNKHVSSRTKHIDIRQHYMREHLNSEFAIIRKIDSIANFADILTKNVNVKTFEKFSNPILNGFRDYENKFTFSRNQRENI